MLIPPRMISLYYIWGADVLVRPDLEEVIVCNLLLSSGPCLLLVDLSVAHLLVVVNHRRINIKDVLQLIWILNGLWRRSLIATALGLFNFLGAAGNRWLPLLLLLRLLVLVLLDALLVNYGHLGESGALEDAPSVPILLRNAWVLSIILNLRTKKVHNFIFIIVWSHQYHLVAPYHLFLLLLRNDLVGWKLIGHLCVKIVIVVIRLGVEVASIGGCLLWNIAV